MKAHQLCIIIVAICNWEAKIMRDILVIGNGFDLAHGLPTSYNDFLYLMKNWVSFHTMYESVKIGYDINKNEEFYKYLTNACDMNDKNIQLLGKIIENNSWVKYYCKCEAEIDGWIDFEREIYPNINLFGKVVSQTRYLKITHGTIDTEIYISRSLFDDNELSTVKLWNEYFKVDDTSIIVQSKYVSRQYGILKKKILDSLRQSFDEFINAFEIYLYEIVYRKENIPVFDQIKKINPQYVVSFNYTLTEKLYGVKEENVHHIHGMMREDLSIGNNNMVLGVNEQANQNMDFIYFVKYFQRIQKASGVKYKKFVEKNIINNAGIIEKDEYKLHIYGHSLDETDGDILKYMIGSIGEREQLILNPKQVIIYYYDSFDYEQKVINLIKLYGRALVEELMENETFMFVPIDHTIYSKF